ncbi:uncharacterized protein MYCFIDRAFT_180138 [Pseudocercospora fijiensis CIRAD86]|uniref:Uncharacterized protein n=1 Tax=Pseudocercospora fijiensis (strain CIRAD86) TaxID=383855 RepID=M2YH36_PSEFD|nr:uncharacterized protein MYCFIDRAFT_180138 [Pseudocercospora fijiensis CIRAD86]EME77135.1 hypothetical protein MYCFIDRAFT_180138 [Pseudocercospora fijiensis CIRAD86]
MVSMPLGQVVMEVAWWRSEMMRSGEREIHAHQLATQVRRETMGGTSSSVDDVRYKSMGGRWATRVDRWAMKRCCRQSSYYLGKAHTHHVCVLETDLLKMNKAKAQARRRREESASESEFGFGSSIREPGLSTSPSPSRRSSCSPPATLDLDAFTDLTISRRPWLWGPDENVPKHPPYAADTYAADHDYVRPLTPPTTPTARAENEDEEDEGTTMSARLSAMKEMATKIEHHDVARKSKHNANALATSAETMQGTASRAKAQTFKTKEKLVPVQAPARKARTIIIDNAGIVPEPEHNAKAPTTSNSMKRAPMPRTRAEEAANSTPAILVWIVFILSMYVWGASPFACLSAVQLPHVWRPVETPLSLLKTCASMRVSSSYEYFARESPGFYHPPTSIANLSYAQRIHDALPVADEASSTLLMGFITNTVAVERLLTNAPFMNFADSWRLSEEYKKQLGALTQDVGAAISAVLDSTSDMSWLPDSVADLVAAAIGKLSSSILGMSPDQQKSFAIARILSAIKTMYPIEQNLIERFHWNLENTGRDAEHALFLARWYSQWSLNQLSAWKIIQIQSQHFANVELAEDLSHEIESYIASLDQWLAFVKPYAGVAYSDDWITFEQPSAGSEGTAAILGFAEQVLPSDGWKVEGDVLDDRGKLEDKCWESLKKMGFSEKLTMVEMLCMGSLASAYSMAGLPPSLSAFETSACWSNINKVLTTSPSKFSVLLLVLGRTVSVVSHEIRSKERRGRRQLPACRIWTGHVWTGRVWTGHVACFSATATQSTF